MDVYWFPLLLAKKHCSERKGGVVMNGFELWRERFVASMRKRAFSERTVTDYGLHLTCFFRFLSQQGITSLSQVTRDTLFDYQTFLFYYEKKGRKLSTSTQGTRLIVVRSFFRFLVKERVVLYDPTADIELPRRKKNIPHGIMSVNEVVRVLEAAYGDDPLSLRDRAILEVLYSTGIRNTELRTLSMVDADLTGRQLRITNGKGKKGRVVPLGDLASRALERYLKEGRPHFERVSPSLLLFVSVHGRQISSSNLVWIVRKYIKRAHLPRGEAITPHCFRHTCATHMLKGKADLRHIQELLGHASVQTTQIYTKVELSNLQEVHRRCHPREKLSSR
jgi:integrase/recombinase XerD